MRNWSKLSQNEKLAYVKSMAPQERTARFLELFAEITQFSEMCGFGDPMSYARGREIAMAGVLGHTVADTYSGEDATRQDGTLAEYKSTIGKSINGAYNGISVQPTWREMVRYLKLEKIGKYPGHYFARFAHGEIVEMWEMTGDDVLSILLPKLQDKYERKMNGKRQYKDPRLGASVTCKEIHSMGRKLI